VRRPVFLLIALAAAGCLSPTPPPPPYVAPVVPFPDCGLRNAIDDRVEGFGFCYARNWVRLGADNETYLVSPPEPGSGLTSTLLWQVQHVGPGVSVDSARDRLANASGRPFDDFVFLSQRPLEVGGVPAWQVEYSWTDRMAERNRDHAVDTVFLRNGTAYTFSYLSRDGHEDFFRAELDADLATFRFTGFAA
jgi:hypothetical protein